MSFTLSGQIVNLTVTIAYEDINGSNLIVTDPKSGQYGINKINALADGQGVEIVHSDTAEG